MTLLAAATPADIDDPLLPEPKASGSSLFAVKHDGSVFNFDGIILDSTFDELLLWANEHKASDITIQTNEYVKAEIGADIVPISNRPVTAVEIDRMVRYAYGEHGPGMLKAAHDLDPSHEVRMKVGLKRYRVNMTAGRIPGGDGVQITVRTLPSAPIPIEQLGIEDDIIRNIRPRNGMVLVTGPTGSGKSTLLSSCLRYLIEKPDANEKVLEYSSPIEYVYDGIEMPSSSIWQTEVGRHLLPHQGGAEDGGYRVRDDESLYAYAIRNALRRKPTVIMVGETRDRATMMASMEASLTGHLLFSTLHVVGVSATLRRILQFFPGDQRDSVAVDIMESIRMIVTQLLFPRIGGGRVALREYMVFDDHTRAQFLKRPVDEWPRFARLLMGEKRVTSKRMTDSAWDAYEAGLITPEVYKQIVVSERDMAAGS